MNTLVIGLVLAAVVPPGQYVIHEKVQAPVFVDECGFLSDSYSYVESATGKFEWRASVVTNADGSFETVTLRAVPVEPYEFRGADKKRQFTFTYTNDQPC